MQTTVKFGLIGLGGYIAPRHLAAITHTNNILVAATDPKDSVGIIDRYFPDAQFFPEIERFFRYLEKARYQGKAVDYVSICSPNFLHDAHIRMSLRAGANVICEKPLVINPWNFEMLEHYEQETNCKVFNVLQLRLHPVVRELYERVQNEDDQQIHDVDLTYITRRGHWYHVSWKGNENQSGGLAMNIGVHFFDMLIWIFGEVLESQVFLNTDGKMSGFLRLKKARIRWFLSVDADDIPAEIRAKGQYAFRSINVDGNELEFTHGFTDLHNRVYEDILSGGGYGIQDARPSIDLVYGIRQAPIQPVSDLTHPLVKPEG